MYADDFNEIDDTTDVLGIFSTEDVVEEWSLHSPRIARSSGDQFGQLRPSRRVSIVETKSLAICDSVQKNTEGKDFRIWVVLRMSRVLCDSATLELKTGH